MKNYPAGNLSAAPLQLLPQYLLEEHLPWQMHSRRKNISLN